MGFSKEIQDFVQGFGAGVKIATPDEYEQRRREKAEDNANIDGMAAQGLGTLTAPHLYGNDKQAVDTGDGTFTRKNMTGAGAALRAAGLGAGSVAGGVEDRFIGAIQESGLKNPYGLAAIAAYGKHESRYSPDNVGRSWNDPSESGQNAQSGGIMSWRAERLANMKRATAGASDPVVAQAKFLLQEDPELIRKLNSAKSAEEANEAMAQAWRFAGYDKPGGEKAARLATTKQYLPKFASFATGGAVPDEEELAEMNRSARRGSMPAVEVATIGPGGWTEPAVPAPQAVTAVAIEPATDDRVEVPLPPRRPGEDQLVARRAIETGPLTAYTGGRQTAPAQRGTMPVHQVEPGKPETAAFLPGIAEAIDAGMQALGKAFGFDDNSRAVPTAGDYPDRAGRLGRNEGAATPAEIREIDRTIDPEGKLSADARAVARMHAGVNYYTQRGEYDKAAAYSKSIILYIRNNMQAAGAVAEDRLKAGDVKGATRAIQEAHNQVPDGSTMYVDKIGPDGTVDYRMMDEYGELTERGSAKVNQLMQLATGMKNGSEWFRQMTNARSGSMTAAQRLAEQRRQNDEAALTEFNRDDMGPFRASMSDTQRSAFDKMSPQVQQQMAQRWANEQRVARGERSLELREGKAAAAEAKSERADADKETWGQYEERIVQASEALNEQMQIDPYDEAKIAPLRQALKDANGEARSWIGQGPRADYSKNLRELQKLTGSGGPTSGGSVRNATGGASGMGGGGRAQGGRDEREDAALDEQLRKMELDTKRNGNKPEDVQRLRLMRGEVAFQKRAVELDERIQLATQEKLAEVVTGQKGVEVPEEKKEQLYNYQEAVFGILRGKNNISDDAAIDLVRAAVKSGRLMPHDDGRYSVDGSRPVFISPEGLKGIARLYKAQKAAAVPAEAGPARFVSPVEEEEQRPVAEARARREATATQAQLTKKQAEIADFKEKLGQYYRPNMTLPQMRKTYNDMLNRDRRRQGLSEDVASP